MQNSSAIDCDFDKSLCQWTQSATDDFDWSRMSSNTESSNTGPNGDHTDPSGNGYYLYTEGSKPRVQGDKADLISPMLQAGIDYCFHLATNMYGDSMGSIAVLLESVTQGITPFTLVKYSQNDITPTWTPRDINIPSQKHNFTIVIEGVIGSDFASDAAIDDVRIKVGRC